ncbi:hypothetical protein DSO57_1032249 [Entomophthora muscae]|uniref:Uncharacterized protein n=1 Tax=Entomophthora muscae TaxID=34485 RepID=A0ACC2RRD1_9FUNG|nr:hypothetical protein DSO57_1032249 [Entomophthora muscae]
MRWSSLDHYKQRTWAHCILVMATIWCELDTSLAIGSRQRRGVPSRRIPQTMTKVISNHNLTSEEEVDESKKNNEAEEDSPLDNLDHSTTVGQYY